MPVSLRRDEEIYSTTRSIMCLDCSSGPTTLLHAVADAACHPPSVTRRILFAVVCLLACSSDPGEAAPEPSTFVRTDPLASSKEFFAAPWPDDRRLDENGRVRTIDVPNPHKGPLFDIVLRTGDGLVSGWGLSSPVYVPLTGALDPASLPSSPAESRGVGASVFLVAIDPPSSERVPLEFAWMPEASSFLPADILAVRPVVGFPLEPGTTYALVVTTAVRDASGAAVGAQPLFRNALLGRFGANPSEVARLAPLTSWLDANDVDRGRVAGAVIFTTQRILDEMLAIRDTVLAGPAPALESLSFVRTMDGYTQFTGRYRAPNFQHGVPPYLEGGDFRFDASGKAIVAVEESLRLTICVPFAATGPDRFPLVVYSHGTGGDFESVVRDDTCKALTAEGLAVASIDQVLHGPRAPAGSTCFGRDVEECFFNILNAVAGRNTIRQSAIDVVSLRRLFETLEVPPSVDPQQRTIAFDLSRLGFFGHSQGALTGSLYAAIDPALSGALLSATGGHLTTTILERDRHSLRDLASGPLVLNLPTGESLHQFHPALAVIQTLGEAADPMSYGRYWFERPEGQRKHIFMTSGHDDDATPAATAQALAAAGGVPQLLGGQRDSLEHQLRGLLPVPAPVRGNIEATATQPAVTAVLRQFPGQGHFPIFRDPTARTQLKGYFRTLAADGTPSVVAP